MAEKHASGPMLLAVAHGTRSERGIDQNRNLIEAVRRLRPDVQVQLCWLDIAEPSLAQALADCAGPVVVVPVLLSTGYHVKIDIPALVRKRPATVLARHLGPDPQVVRAVLDRLGEVAGKGTIALVGAGSTDPDARVELATAAARLQDLCGRTVHCTQLTEADPLSETGAGDHIASYLLADGYFFTRLVGMAAGRKVSEPIGMHPLIARLIVQRYDEARLSPRPDVSCSEQQVGSAEPVSPSA